MGWLPVTRRIRFRRIRSPRGKESATSGDDHVPPLPATLRSISTTSVAIELDQPLVADPEVMRDLVEHDVPDLAA